MSSIPVEVEELKLKSEAEFLDLNLLLKLLNGFSAASAEEESQWCFVKH